VKYLNHDQFQVKLITLSRNPSNNLEKEFSGLNADLHPLSMNRPSSFLIGRRRLNAVLNILKPDVIHSQGLRADWLCANFNRYPTRITTQRNNPFDDYPALYGTLIGSAVARLHHRALLQIPTVVTCSKTISGTNILRGLQSIVIQNGVELEGKARLITTKEKATRRRELNLPTNGRLFVYAGPLIARKDPALLIRSFLDYADRNDTLCLLGDGPLLPACRRLAGNQKNIFLPGLVRNVIDYFRAADLFVSASHAEGMPNAVLEALSASLPVILSDIPAHREVLGNCSEAGWLFTPSDPTALGKCLDQAVADVPTRRAALQLVEQQFSAQSMSNAYQRLYESTLKQT
jgi:glycosyltransferase involved in cell wall biosynthesis